MSAYQILLVLTYSDIEIIACQIIETPFLCITERYCFKLFPNESHLSHLFFVVLLKDEALGTLILLLLYFTYFNHSSRGDERNGPRCVTKHGSLLGLERNDMAYFTCCSCIICFILRNSVLSLDAGYLCYMKYKRKLQLSFKYACCLTKRRMFSLSDILASEG